MVVLANGGLHDVGHRCTAVNNDPLPVFLTLNAGLGKPVFSHLVTHARGQGFGLAVGGATGDDHTLKEGGQVLGVVDADVLRFDVFQGIDHHPLEFLDVFFFCSFSHEVKW